MCQRQTELSHNLQLVQEEIVQQAILSDRDPRDIHLVAVSKTHPLSDILALHQAGQKVFGENKVQELCSKMEEADQVPEGQDISWHLIGTLQRNKVRFVVGKVALIHSVHSVKLIKQIERLAAEQAVIQDILLQVNIAREASKQGFEIEELGEAYNYLEACPHLRLRGLMTMAPDFENKEEALPIFQACHALYQDLQKVYGQEQINTLSMGMSADFHQAIAAGATHIRIGSHIFGARDYGRSND